MLKHILTIPLFLLFACNINAQTTVLNTLPLNEEIDITILGSDDALLYCYNLYGFQYYNGQDSIVGEFIVLKDADSFKEKTNLRIKLCRVKEFSVAIGKGCRNIKVEDGVQVRHKGEAEPIYLNFDPLGPEPVFIPCK